MKLSTSLIALCLSTVVSSEGLSLFGSGSQKAFTDDINVPGDNPLRYCKPEHGSDILKLEIVNLSPNPPVPGSTLQIEATGTFDQEILEGAYVNLQVKYGLIRLINQSADLCEQIKNVDLECPLKKGLTKIVKEVEIPKEIPPGTYTVFADAFTADDEHITCLTATVTF
ncbi:putative phosphatidylglycerol transfer protein [Coleophoma crateriformis]|uniref:Phosphatidylglycerol/phosphatidylinositol transfer protein n=1 Tax=Coleophoma crateriformis TaxID=565419 RepID=A0A3D8T0K6_9HELO|nr:putative phosphatidylglycerol transfer protein [Coleophoma crateriformis]